MQILTGISDEGKYRLIGSADGVFKEVSKVAYDSLVSKGAVEEDLSLGVLNDVLASVPSYLSGNRLRSKAFDDYIIGVLECLSRSKNDEFRSYLQFPEDISFWKKRYLWHDEQLSMYIYSDEGSRYYLLTHWGLFVNIDVEPFPIWLKPERCYGFMMHWKTYTIDEYGVLA